MMQGNMTFGKRLTTLLVERGWSQSTLGDMIKYDKSTVSRWCMDDAEPRLTAITSLCKVFNVSADYLLFGKERK